MLQQDSVSGSIGAGVSYQPRLARSKLLLIGIDQRFAVGVLNIEILRAIDHRHRTTHRQRNAMAGLWLIRRIGRGLAEPAICVRHLRLSRTMAIRRLEIRSGT